MCYVVPQITPLTNHPLMGTREMRDKMNTPPPSGRSTLHDLPASSWRSPHPAEPWPGLQRRTPVAWGKGEEGEEAEAHRELLHGQTHTCSKRGVTIYRYVATLQYTAVVQHIHITEANTTKSRKWQPCAQYPTCKFAVLLQLYHLHMHVLYRGG